MIANVHGTALHPRCNAADGTQLSDLWLWLLCEDVGQHCEKFVALWCTFGTCHRIQHYHAMPNCANWLEHIASIAAWPWHRRWFHWFPGFVQSEPILMHNSLGVAASIQFVSELWKDRFAGDCIDCLDHLGHVVVEWRWCPAKVAGKDLVHSCASSVVSVVVVAASEMQICIVGVDSFLGSAACPLLGVCRMGIVCLLWYWSLVFLFARVANHEWILQDLLFWCCKSVDGNM